jgi:hypothetical protein
MGKRQGGLSDAERAQRRERERERLERAVEELLTRDGWRRWLKAVRSCMATAAANGPDRPRVRAAGDRPDPRRRVPRVA